MMCGSALANPAAAAEERKVVTVLFADLVGFTSRSEAMDVEDVGGTLRPYHQLLRQELERYGGTVEKFAGDAVLALFGAPTTHEDDAERAVRSALAIQDALARLRTDDERLDLHVRIGVNTGEVLVAVGANPWAGEGMAFGDVVNTAARLQAKAPVDGILVGEATFRASRSSIDYVEAEPILAKGKTDPVPVWVVRGARSPGDLQDGDRSHRLPLVGRDAEIDALSRALDRALGDRAVQLCTVVGVPGIGKSRLVEELADRVDADPAHETTWRQGRSLPYGDGVTFWALAEIVRAEAGVLHSDSGEAAARKLDAHVQDLLPADARASWVLDHLRPLLGLGTGADASRDRQAEAFAGWQRYVEALAQRRPTVLVFEDLHWADDAMLDFVEHLLDRTTEVPLLILCTARPELLTRRAGWGRARPNASVLTLPALTPADTARLLSSVLQQTVLPAELQQAVLERASGNPLYAQEYVRMLVDRGLLEQRGGRWELERHEGLPLPETVQGVIAARIDTLPAAEKAMLQDASVIGRVVWPAAVASLSDRPPSAVRSALENLTRQAFLRREDDSSVGGEDQYAFEHALIRDVAYGTIVRRQRAEKHERAALWIEDLSGDRGDRIELLAHHHLAALDLTRALRLERPELERRAGAALLAAGQHALALSAFPAAQRYLERALELTGPPAERARVLAGLARAEHRQFETPSDRMWEARAAVAEADMTLELAEIETMIGISLANNGRFEEGLRHASEGGRLAADLPDSATKGWILNQLASFYIALPDLDTREGVRLATRALAICDAIDDADVRLQALVFRGQGLLSLDDPTGIEETRRSIEIAMVTPTGGSVLALNNAAAAHWEVGDLATHRALLGPFRERAAQLGATFWEDVADALADVVTPYLDGEWERAEAGISLLTGRASRSGAIGPYYAATTEIRIALARADDERAARCSDDVLGLADTGGRAGMFAEAHALAGEVALRAGNEIGAREHYARAVAAWRSHPQEGMFMIGHIVSLAVRLGGAEGLVSELERRRIPNAWREAAIAIARGDHQGAASIYATMGERPAEAAARFDAARALVDQGRIPDGMEMLEGSLWFWRRVDGRYYLKAADRLITRTVGSDEAGDVVNR
jgi:class 3 adenylate cyclase/tetratricopeptide (TPR) repeat protein